MTQNSDPVSQEPAAGLPPTSDIIYPSAVPFVLVHLACFGAICVFQFVLAVMSQSTAQKSVLWWAANHRDHHLYSDTELDVHSPRHSGFLYSHLGWIFSRRHTATNFTRVADFARYPELLWLHRYELGPRHARRRGGHCRSQAQTAQDIVKLRRRPTSPRPARPAADDLGLAGNVRQVQFAENRHGAHRLDLAQPLMEFGQPAFSQSRGGREGDSLGVEAFGDLQGGATDDLGPAAEPQFVEYARATLRNSRALATALLAEGVTLITGGTDNHLLVIDTMASFGLDGRAAEEALDAIGVTANKQIIPDDPRPPLRPSGLRLGTPACTTRGMSKEDMTTIAQWIVRTLRRPDDAPTIEALRAEVKTMCRRYPVPGIS